MESQFEYEVALAIGLSTRSRSDEIVCARLKLEEEKKNWINPDILEMSPNQREILSIFNSNLREYLTKMTCDKEQIDSAILEIRISNVYNFFDKKEFMFSVVFSDDYEPLNLHYTSYNTIENNKLLDHKENCCGYSCDYYGCDLYGDGIDHGRHCDGNMCKTWKCQNR
jgi:hypothetical protein